MPTKDLGTKHTCFKCGTRYYDLKRPEPVCPKCGVDPRESPSLRPANKAERKRVARAVLEAPAVVEETLDEDALSLDDEEPDGAPDDQVDEKEADLDA